MKLIHILGRQNHGKTTLIVDLVEEYKRRGVAVGTIKHSSHAHELDTPGKDSYRQRQAGASAVAVIAAEMLGLWLPRNTDANPYALLAPMFSACRLALVEGDIDAEGTKIEVWREAIGGPCLAETHHEIQAIVTDDVVETRAPYGRGTTFLVSREIFWIWLKCSNAVRATNGPMANISSASKKMRKRKSSCAVGVDKFRRKKSPRTVGSGYAVKPREAAGNSLCAPASLHWTRSVRCAAATSRRLGGRDGAPRGGHVGRHFAQIARKEAFLTIFLIFPHTF